MLSKDTKSFQILYNIAQCRGPLDYDAQTVFKLTLFKNLRPNSIAHSMLPLSGPSRKTMLIMVKKIRLD